MENKNGESVRQSLDSATRKVQACKSNASSADVMRLFFEVKRGNDEGLTPHRYRDKRFRMRKKARRPLGRCRGTPGRILFGAGLHTENECEGSFGERNKPGFY
jgi:hypothetical protein